MGELLNTLALIIVGTSSDKIVAGARLQLSWGTVYDGRYVKLSYPGGDVPKERGVCTDVVVRALRHAGHDLQKLIHEDMKVAWDAYPRYPGVTKPDRNIDHRRVPNQRVFFRRHGRTLTIETFPGKRAEWKAGDFVSWKLDSGLDHIGVLTDRRGASGWPMAIHNLSTTLEEDVLLSWKITGHYRYPK